MEPPNLKYLYALYDYKQMKVFTEALVVSKSSYQNVRVLFTDLNRRDTDRERVYLVCYVVRIGKCVPNVNVPIFLILHNVSSYVNTGHDSPRRAPLPCHKLSLSPLIFLFQTILSYLNPISPTDYSDCSILQK